MKTYDWVLFDADDTLFHFDAFRGLQCVFSQFNFEFTKDHYATYQAVNKSLWVAYQNDDISAEQLQHRRFIHWASELQTSPQHLNNKFLSVMSTLCQPLEGAVSMLNILKNNTKLGIITNGFHALQQARLENTGLKDYFDLLVVSEQVGFAKPHPGIFEYALSKMGNSLPGRVLMVGDTPESDILGGINAGLDTCWLNVNNRSIPKNITPNYQVASLAELENLLVQKQHILSNNFTSA